MNMMVNILETIFCICETVFQSPKSNIPRSEIYRQIKKSRGCLLQTCLRVLHTEIFLSVFNFPFSDLTLQIKPVRDLLQAQSVFSQKRTSTIMK